MSVDQVGNNVPVDSGTQTQETEDTSFHAKREAEIKVYDEIVSEINTVIAELGGGTDAYISRQDLERKFSTPEKAQAFLDSVKSAKSNPGDTLPSSVLYKTVTLDHVGLNELSETKAGYDSAVSAHGGSSIDFDLFLARFDGDVAKFEQYLEKRDALVAAEPSITKEQVDEWAKQEMAMASTPSNGNHLVSTLDKAIANHGAFKESLDAHGGSSIDFNAFLSHFDGDIGKFTAYLENRDQIIALDPSITKEQIDEWAKQELAALPGSGSALVSRMDCVISGHNLLQGTEGYTLMGSLSDKAASSSPYAASVDFATGGLEMTQERMELLKEIKQLSGELLTEYNKAKNAGDSSDESQHMKDLRLQLGQKILAWEGVPPEQIPTDLDSVVNMCSEKGYSLGTDRNGGDDKHNKEEWGINIIMLENINEQFKAENGELMSYLQQFSKLIEQVLQIASAASEAMNDLVKGT